MTHVFSDDVRRIAADVLKLYDGKPERWTKNHMARDSDGRMTVPRAGGCYYPADKIPPAPVCWCVMGAAENVRREYHDIGFGPFIDTFSALLAQKLGLSEATCIAVVNDHERATFEMVVDVLTEMTK